MIDRRSAALYIKRREPGAGVSVVPQVPLTVDVLHQT